MKKLRRRELDWIINRLKRGFSVYFIAKTRKVSCRWVRHIHNIYLKTGEAPIFKKPGRKQTPISEEERLLILRTWREYPLNALNLEKYFMVKLNEKIPHNRIHKVLKESGKALDEPKKQERRKWVRYERKHSNSMWHTDWTELPSRRYLIIYEDDASRFIVGYGVFETATMGNALKVFKNAVREYGHPKQLLSDNGMQFRFNEAFDRAMDVENKFQKNMKKMRVKQIFTRVHHPQTNGKLERLFHTLKRLITHFGTVAKAIEFYNLKRPHMSLNFDILETPHQAFIRKMRN
jgi:putative transposase